MASLIPYAPLSEKQQRYIRRTLHSWLNVAEGGKRAGKNIINLIAWAICIDEHPDKLHLAVGVSISAATLNIIDSNGFGLEYIFAGRCHRGQYDGRDALYVTDVHFREKIILITGGADKTAVPKIKGNTYGSAYITEANECHPDMVKEVFTRTLTSNDRKIFHDLNPMSPSHWYYREILDFYTDQQKAGTISGFNYEHFTVLDNLSISDEKLHALIATYDRGSLWYQRDILGLRTSASGRVYTSYRYADVAVSPADIRKMHFNELAVGVDIGGTDATVATLCGVTQGYKDVVLIDGMYDKQGISDKMDETTYVKMVIQWLIPWTMVFPSLGTIYVDSANKLFRKGLEKQLIQRGLGRFVVHAFDKSDGILSRIELNSMLFAQGRFKISANMQKWHEAYQNATWVPEEYANGNWVRTDDGSYPVDALDSAEYAFYGFRRYLI